MPLEFFCFVLRILALHIHILLYLFLVGRFVFVFRRFVLKKDQTIILCFSFAFYLRFRCCIYWIFPGTEINYQIWYFSSELQKTVNVNFSFEWKTKFSIFGNQYNTFKLQRIRKTHSLMSCVHSSVFIRLNDLNSQL